MKRKLVQASLLTLVIAISACGSRPAAAPPPSVPKPAAADSQYRGAPRPATFDHCVAGFIGTSVDPNRRDAVYVHGPLDSRSGYRVERYVTQYRVADVDAVRAHAAGDRIRGQTVLGRDDSDSVWQLTSRESCPPMPVTAQR